MNNSKEILKRKNTVLWDWNGTLLNDVGICIASMNALLSSRGMQLLDYDYYRRVFNFPVKSYYQTIGFDFSREDFEVPAMEFIDGYASRLHMAGLFEDVEETLMHFHQSGMRQFILSAMEQQALMQSVKQLGIGCYFEKIYGIDNHYAYGKTHLAEILMKNEVLHPQDCVLIGDSLHDLEVARHLGVDCILVSRGHQHESRLLKHHSLVVENLRSFVE